MLNCQKHAVWVISLLTNANISLWFKNKRSKKRKLAEHEAHLLPGPQQKKVRIQFFEKEIDSLTQWFNDDGRPSKEAINEYTNILNNQRQVASISLLTNANISLWFKNKRSKKRKLAEHEAHLSL